MDSQVQAFTVVTGLLENPLTLRTLLLLQSGNNSMVHCIYLCGNINILVSCPQNHVSLKLVHDKDNISNHWSSKIPIQYIVQYIIGIYKFIIYIKT